jgi:hypothetical protein
MLTKQTQNEVNFVYSNMVVTPAKSVSEVGGTMKKNFDFNNRVIRGVLVVLAAVFLIVAVYYVVSSEGSIPGLPRIQLTDDNQDRVTADLLSRIKGYEPNSVEKELALQLVGIHRLETAQNVEGAKLDEALKLFGRKASSIIHKDKKRYLLLGDYLAFDFAQALEKCLLIARRDGFDAMGASQRKKIEEIEVKGGSFLNRALRRGVIGDKGQLYVPRITPQVLFRIRWRHMGGLDIQEDLSSVERKAYFDFIVAFTNPLSVKRRLGAIKQLKEMDDSYDDLTARAIILHESGSDQYAYKVLKNAIDQGRSDVEILNFAKALR